MGSIGADSGNRTKRTREEMIRDELPNLPDNNKDITCPSDEDDLNDVLPIHIGPFCSKGGSILEDTKKGLR